MLTKRGIALVSVSLAITLCLIALGNIYAQQRKIVILNGIPSSRVTSGVNGTTREELSNSEKNEYRVLVTKVGDNYIWETREKKHLIKVKSGVYVYFFSPSGYIKIATNDSPVDEPLSYMEHVTLGLVTITYWGTLEDFQDE